MRIRGVLMTCAQLNKNAIKPLEMIKRVQSRCWTLYVSLKKLFLEVLFFLLIVERKFFAKNSALP